MQKEIMTTNEKIIKQKEDLAAQALQVAEDSLELLKDQLADCSTRDLVQVFNSAIKAHREIVSDIVTLTEKESEKEAQLAKEYDGKVGELLRKLQ
jgi:hypothetical protein